MPFSSSRLDSTRMGTGDSAADAADDFDAVEIGQAQIENHQIGLLVTQQGQSLAAGGGLDDPIGLDGQGRAQQPADRRLVVDDEDGGADRWSRGILPRTGVPKVAGRAVYQQEMNMPSQICVRHAGAKIGRQERPGATN